MKKSIKRVIVVSLAIAMILIMTVSMLSCGAKKDVYKVGVCQLIQHPALDAATQGFQDALKQELGDKVEIDVQNAAGESANCATIVNTFVSSNVDLIMANATAALQAAAAATDKIPVLGTSITDYGSALDISFTGTIGTNVSGTSDLAPLDKQAEMIPELVPTAKKVGIIYCASEANSVYQVVEITKNMVALGLTVTPYSFTDSNDIAAITQKACDENDVIYIPTDNTAANNTEAIANVVLAAKKPVIAGEEGICKGCGVATLSINYYDLGFATGLMAAKILKGEANVAEMAVEYAPKAIKEYNAANCAELGITPPADYVAIAD